MKNLRLFNSSEFGTVRIIEENGSILFCGRDVAKALGYAKPRNAISAYCKDTCKQDVLTNGGNQLMTFIPEGDLYNLFVHSKLPSVEKFKRWVYNKVLPSLHESDKNEYQNIIFLKEDMEYFKKKFCSIEFIIDVMKEIQSDRYFMAIQRLGVEKLATSSKKTDTLVESEALMTINSIAKWYGLSANSLNKILQNMGVQFRDGGSWRLHQRYLDRGYAKTKFLHLDNDEIISITYWTWKGRYFIHSLMYELGYYKQVELEKKEEENPTILS